MKSLVVYYSRTGNTKKVAEEIARVLQCDIEELHDQQKRKGLMGYLRSGREAITKQNIIVQELQNQPKNYDAVIIGTPIWAWTMSTPIRAFLEQYKADFTKVAFFCTSDSTPGEKTFSYMKEVCGKQPLNTLSITKKDLTANTYQEQIQQFIHTLQ
jgi:menaquinone-dependent protoporphyrinogen IX oxidase